MEITGPSVPGGRGRGRILCRARRLEAPAATPISVAASTPVSAAAASTPVPVAAASTPVPVAAAATPVPVAAGATPSVPGGHGRARNRRRSRRRQGAGGATSVSVAAGLITRHSLANSGGDCAQMVDVLHGVVHESYPIKSSFAANVQLSVDQALLEEQTASNTSIKQVALSKKETRSGKERKRKPPKVHDIFYEVYRVLVNPAKKKFAHRLGNPVDLAKIQEDTSYFPYVSFKKERLNNRHAFNIMAFSYHANILRLKRISDDKSNVIEKGLIAFVEPVKGTLDSIFPPEICMDTHGFIPSESFRTAVSEVAKGLCFLWMNGLYHGNLNWNNTYYNHNHSVKLANFEVQDSVSLEEAQIMDRDNFVSMLQQVSNEAIHLNPNCSSDLIDCLIHTLSEIDIKSLVGLEKSILHDLFFWTPGERKAFYAETISMKLKDEKFETKLPSDICLLPWKTSYDQDFIELVEAMDAYRDRKGWSAYNAQSRKHFVSCICGAYAHNKELKVNVDGTVTKTFPRLPEKLCYFDQND